MSSELDRHEPVFPVSAGFSAWMQVLRIVASANSTSHFAVLGLRWEPRPEVVALARRELDEATDLYGEADDAGAEVRALVARLALQVGERSLDDLAALAAALDPPEAQAWSDSEWAGVLSRVAHGEELVAPPAGVGRRVRWAILASAWECGLAPDSEGEEDYSDPWESDFSIEHPEMEPESIVFAILQRWRIARTLAVIDRQLSKAEARAVEEWATEEAQAWLARIRLVDYVPAVRPLRLSES